MDRPAFVLQKIFSRNLAAIHQMKPVLALDKPIYVGFITIDLNKLLMYEFHYNYINMIAKHDCSTRLISTDTQSLVYEIETDDVYEDF